MLLLLSAIAALLQAAPETAAREPAPFQVGVLVWSATIPGQVAMREGLEAEAARLDALPGRRGVRLDVHVAGDGRDGIERQIEQMRALVARRVDAIIVQPTDNAALVGALKEANAAGIPVVAYDQYISGGRLAAYVTSDNRQAGALGGEYLASRFPDDHEIRLVLVEYPHVSSTVERLDGFLDTLGRLRQPYRILATYKAVEPVAGAAAGRQILADFPEKGSLDAVFTVNDGGGLAVVDALAGAGRDELLVATIDGDAASVANIRAGRLTVIDSAQFCGKMGAEAMKLAWDVLHGERVPRLTLIPTFPVTLDTVDRYHGWGQPLPERFLKPWPSLDPWWEPTFSRVEAQ